MYNRFLSINKVTYKIHSRFHVGNKAFNGLIIYVGYNQINVGYNQDANLPDYNYGIFYFIDLILL